MYENIPPGSRFQAFIDAYWIYENQSDYASTETILPDGCIDIILPMHASGGEPLVVGFMSQSRQTAIMPGQKLFGIRFRPGCASAFLQVPLAEISDQILPLSGVQKQLSSLQTIDFVTRSQFIHEIQNCLEKAFGPVYALPKVIHTVRQIETAKGLEPIALLAQRLGWSRRHLERTFKTILGASPKEFAQIVRFQNIHSVLRQAGLKNILEKALEAGYYDQAHFNREFKKLTGFYPTHEKMSHFYNK